MKNQQQIFASLPSPLLRRSNRSAILPRLLSILHRTRHQFQNATEPHPARRFRSALFLLFLLRAPGMKSLLHARRTCSSNCQPEPVHRSRKLRLARIVLFSKRTRTHSLRRRLDDVRFGPRLSISPCPDQRRIGGLPQVRFASADSSVDLLMAEGKSSSIPSLECTRVWRFGLRSGGEHPSRCVRRGPVLSN